jgi:hypothetical protein
MQEEKYLFCRIKCVRYKKYKNTIKKSSVFGGKFEKGLGLNRKRFPQNADKCAFGACKMAVFSFRKGKRKELQNEVNEFVAMISADGTLKALEEKWFGAKEPTEFASYDDLDGTNGTITVAINSASKPFVYLKNNKFVGFHIEFVVAFAKENGCYHGIFNRQSCRCNYAAGGNDRKSRRNQCGSRFRGYRTVADSRSGADLRMEP